MTEQDDTLGAERKQAHEHTLMSLLDAGALAGVLPVRSMQALERHHGDALVVYRVPREVAEHGALAGTMVAQRLLVVPPQHHGSVMLAFDGWADDPRPLCCVPVVVQFCAGLLLGEQLQHQEQAQRVLPVLLDEVKMAMLTMNHALALEAAGQLWLVAHAYAARVYQRHPISPSGFARAVADNVNLRDKLRKGLLPAGAGEHLP